MINFINTDCVNFMKSKPDGFYDLAIVDPPYGIDNKKLLSLRGYTGKGCPMNKRMREASSEWDVKPTAEYFNELFRVSKNQIIWGGNYFTDMLPPTREWLIWNKEKYSFKHSAFEMAWTSFNGVSKMVKIQHHGFLMKDKIIIHPTQKPVMLYQFILQEYCKKCIKILDTHGGSGSIAIACDMEGFDLDICEIDKKYLDDSIKRYDIYKSQKIILFDGKIN